MASLVLASRWISTVTLLGMTACLADVDEETLAAEQAEIELALAGGTLVNQLPKPPPPRLFDLQLGTGVSCALRGDGTTACVGAIDGGTALLAPAVIANAADSVGLAIENRRPNLLKSSDGTVVEFASTTAIGVAVPGVAGAVELSAGNDNACALRPGGDVWCWGLNLWRELGRDGGASGAATRVNGIADAIDLGVGASGACVVREGGAVWCWGLGKLGSGSAAPARMSWTLAVDVDAGWDFACFQSTTDRVYCFGANDKGQMGYPYADADKHGAHQVQGIGTVVGFDAGATHACAVLTGGAVKCWGSNTSGELGNGNLAAWQQAVSVPLPRAAKRVRAGNGFSCAQLDDDSVWCWGKNDVGQLGLGYASASPVVVPAKSLL